MDPINRKQRSVISLLWSLLAFLAIVLPFQAVADTLRIGTVSTDPAMDVKEFQPLATYLGSRLGDHGIDSAAVVVATSIPQMAELLKTDKVDLYIDSPFPVLLTQNLADNKILLRRWKRGVSTYAGVIFSRMDAGISEIKHLTGKMMALEEPFSTGSYYLPKSYLIRAGLKVSQKADSKENVGANEVGYLFSGDDRNTMAWVLKGHVAAGAINDEKYLKLAKGHDKELLVLAKTQAVPRHVVTYRKNLNARLVEKIRSVLLQMDRSPEGLAALKAFNETTRFDELTGDDHQTFNDLGIKFKAQIVEELSRIRQ